jgi:hypothetical protein
MSAFVPEESDETPTYPLYDVTSSGITQSKRWHFHPPNSRRIPGTPLVRNRNNFGVLELDAGADDSQGAAGAGARLHFSVRGEKGEVLANLTVPLRSLQAPLVGGGGAETTAAAANVAVR